MMNTDKKTNSQTMTNNNKGDRLGLWVGLGAAALTAVGVVGLAIYTDYKENAGTQAGGASMAVESSAPSAVPTSQAQAENIATQTSDQQVKGMTAPSDEEPNGAVVVASQIAIASGVVEPVMVKVASGVTQAALQPVLPMSEGGKNVSSTPVAQSASVAAVATVSAASVPSPADKILAQEYALQAESRVVNENGVVRFYFATGKADVTANTLESLKETVEGAKAGKKVVILTYSNVESNERLARDRALAVRSVLLAAGIPDSQIEVNNPTAESSDSRRVEVILR